MRVDCLASGAVAGGVWRRAEMHYKKKRRRGGFREEGRGDTPTTRQAGRRDGIPRDWVVEGLLGMGAGEDERFEA